MKRLFTFLSLAATLFLSAQDSAYVAALRQFFLTNGSTQQLTAAQKLPRLTPEALSRAGLTEADLNVSACERHYAESQYLLDMARVSAPYFQRQGLTLAELSELNAICQSPAYVAALGHMQSVSAEKSVDVVLNKLMPFVVSLAQGEAVQDIQPSAPQAYVQKVSNYCRLAGVDDIFSQAFSRMGTDQKSVQAGLEVLLRNVEYVMADLYYGQVTEPDLDSLSSLMLHPAYAKVKRGVSAQLDDADALSNALLNRYADYIKSYAAAHQFDASTKAYLQSLRHFLSANFSLTQAAVDSFLIRSTPEAIAQTGLDSLIDAPACQRAYFESQLEDDLAELLYPYFQRAAITSAELDAFTSRISDSRFQHAQAFLEALSLDSPLVRWASRHLTPRLVLLAQGKTADEIISSVPSDYRQSLAGIYELTPVCPTFDSMLMAVVTTAFDKPIKPARLSTMQGFIYRSMSTILVNNCYGTLTTGDVSVFRSIHADSMYIRTQGCLRAAADSLSAIETEMVGRFADWIDAETSRDFIPEWFTNPFDGLDFPSLEEDADEPAAVVETTVVPEPEAEPDDEIYYIVERMPEFPGGNYQLMQWLSSHVHYPQAERAAKVQGRVICQFVVNTDGSIQDVRVMRTSGNKNLDREAIRLIQSMPHWTPGRQRGHAVRCRFTLPVVFRL